MGLKMRLFKKRLAAFVSNWLGVIIAAVIVVISATFGGMYLYGRSKIDNSINFVTQVINMRYPDGLTRVGPVDAPPPYNYNLILQVYNPYSDIIDVSISNVTITADTYTLPVAQVGSWNQNVPNGYTTFEGSFIIDAQTFAALAAKGPVEVSIKGTISGSGQYKWIKRQNQRSFDIPIHGVLFKLNPPS